MKEYYSGMFLSLKHNILLMLNQIEGNLVYSDIDFEKDLTFIQKRLRQIKLKNKKICETKKIIKVIRRKNGGTVTRRKTKQESKK